MPLANEFRRRGRRGALINWLGIDSKIDSSISVALVRIQETWNAWSSTFARFRLSGWRRVASELASESITIGAGGLLILYALALPALLEFDESKFLTGRFSVKFLDQSGNEIGKRGILHNDAIPLDDLPPHLIKAVLATEDRRFFEHFGVDFIGTLRALATNVQANSVVQGGSTLTQQLAKNLFLSSERSFIRKLKEVFLAFLLEARFNKRQILKMYLDRAYMGGGAFGVEAAAQFYFGKSVRDVTLAEAAMMAGLFKAPTKYAPHVNMPAARARTNDVLSNLVDAGYYSPGQVHLARLHPAKVVESRAAYSPDWYLDWAFEEIQRLAEGKNQYVLTARTTLDVSMQKAGEEALASTLRQMGKSQHVSSGSLIAMETDGAVKAIVGGPDYGESQFNRATHAKRQPGSSFKPYVYATALENGYTSKSTAVDSPPQCGNWSPKNYAGGISGSRVGLGEALARSLNTVAVYLSLNVGRQKVVEMTRRLGIKGITPSCSMALGDHGITPMEHTGGIATFANKGRLAKPYAILEIFTSKGDLLYSRERDEPPATQVIAPKVVEQMNQMMQMVVTEGTGKAAALDFTNVVGKTGTSSNYKDAWFVGFTGKYVASIWLGNDDNRPMLNVTGGHGPAPAFHAFMSVVHTSMDIPQILGLPVHPVQAQEQQRLVELQRTQPSATASLAPGADASRKSASLLPEPTREALKKIAVVMRKAVDAPDTAPAAVGATVGRPSDVKTAPESGAKPGAGVRPPEGPGRRADAVGPPAPASLR